VTEAMQILGSSGVNANFVPRVRERRLRILCATDLSRRSENAVQRAAMLMRRRNAQVLLLHVVDARSCMRMIRRKRKLAASVLDWRARKLAGMTGSIDTLVRVGNLRQTIARVATEWDADLVILGAYRKRIGDSFLGTSAEHVMRAAHRPVLVSNRASTEAYARVLLATNISAQVVRITRDLGFLENASAPILQTFGPDSLLMRYAAGISESEIAQHIQIIKKSSSDALSAQLTKVALKWARFSLLQEDSSVLHAVEDAAGRAAPDLVVLSQGRFPLLKRAFRGSVSNHVLRTMSCDVLIVSSAAIQRACGRAAASKSETIRSQTNCMKIRLDPIELSVQTGPKPAREMHIW
jgi:universal stress protein E